jgi:hypothetical protein
MWIRSQPLFTARRPNVSPPGYQSPALGDSVPVPGSQDTQRVTPQPGVTISSLSRTPRLFTSVTSQTRARREVNNEPQVSQWWGHRGLHQHEVLECLTTEEKRQASPNDTSRRLTTTSSPITLHKRYESQPDRTKPNDPTKPSLARTLAAIEGNDFNSDPTKPMLARSHAAFESNDSAKSWIARVLAAPEDDDTDDDTSSSVTLVPSNQSVSNSNSPRRPTRAPSFTSDKPSLPTHESYARQYCLILDHSVKEEPPPDEANSLPGSTLTPAAPGNIQPYTHPEQLPTLFKLGACQQTTPFSSFTMSSTTPSVGDDTHRNKTRNTNNSASREIVTPLTTRKKGKGVSMAEVADPEAYSPTNGNSMPSSGPVLTGPHPTDKVSPGETLSHPAAPQSAKHMPAASRSASAQHTTSGGTSTQLAAPKSANNQPSTSRSTNVQTAASKSANNSIKAPRRSSTSGASHPAAPNQQPQLALPDSTPTFRDDMLNLQAAIQKETADYGLVATIYIM